MTLRIRRTAVRAGAVAVLAAGAVAHGGPAYAGDAADLGVGLSGTTLAATTSGKVAGVTVTNRGPGTAAGVVVVFDLTHLETGKVGAEVPDTDACRTEGTTIVCGVVDIPTGQALDLGIRLTRKAGVGPAGTLTVTVSHSGADARDGNNSATAAVEIAQSGPDLYAYAPDVPFDLATGKVGAVEPGATAKLYYEVGNFGDVAVSGVRLRVTLPRHATFAEAEPGCAYNPAHTVATCTYADLPIVPADEDTDDNDGVHSAVRFVNVLTIAAGTPAPGSLAGGSVSVEGIVPEQETPSVQRRTPRLPRNAVGVPARDVDGTDNTDEFVVNVADPGGGGGGLPVTGARAGLIGAAGLGVLVAGGVLVLLTRRRRVVLVNPTDETPTA